MSPADNDQSEAELLKALLAERDLPCPVCGYNLRAIASSNCPECGAKLDLRVGSTDLQLGPWLAALFAGALPLGIVSFVLVIGLGAGDPILFAVFFVGALAYTMLLAVLVRKRRAFWKQPRKRQWWLAVCSAIVSLVLLLVVIIMSAFLLV
ncbi:MAG: hypothetical protein IH983_06245 [Planctomycetes bacterium]|nr:hypothetical protein [Planctomycetota bacterium]